MSGNIVKSPHSSVQFNLIVFIQCLLQCKLSRRFIETHRAHGRSYIGKENLPQWEETLISLDHWGGGAPDEEGRETGGEGNYRRQIMLILLNDPGQS